MKTYRVGILGCRGRGTAAARAYHAHPRTEVAALCDLKPELLETLGEELGVSARFTDLDEMIRRSEPGHRGDSDRHRVPLRPLA